MNATFYIISKRLNSTKLPDTAGLQKEVILKEPSDILNPVFRVHILGGSYNYLYVEEYNRYYFIDDFRYLTNDIVELSCTIDVLATYRSRLLSSTQYVTRSASKVDGGLVDPYVTVNGGYQTTYTEYPVVTFNSAMQSCYVMGVVANDASSNGGAVTYYAMSQAELTEFMDFMFTSENYAGDALQDEAYKAVFNPFQYIVSLKWFPLYPNMGLVPDPTVNPHFGWWQYSNTSGTLIARRLVLDSYTPFRIDEPIALTKRGLEFLNASPWSENAILFPIIGKISLDSAVIRQYDYIYTDFKLDIVEGQLTCSLFGDSAKTKLITRVSSQMAVDVPIAQISSQMEAAFGAGDAKSVLGSLLSSPFRTVTAFFGSAYSNGLSKATLDTTVAGFTDPTVSISGSGSSRAYWDLPLAKKCIYIHNELPVINEHNEKKGYCLDRMTLLSTLSGYTEILNPSVALSGATSSEIERINAMFEGGFYIE